MKNWLGKYSFLLLSILSTLVFSGYFFELKSTHHFKQVAAFQQAFLNQEKKLTHFLHRQQKQLLADHLILQKAQTNSPFYLHLYQHDSLIFWNTNELPIPALSDISFPKEGLIHLKNGWYYAKTSTRNHTKLCVSFLIKRDYSYENTHLKNEFCPPFNVGFQADIDSRHTTKNAITNQNGDFLFSITPPPTQEITPFSSAILLFLLLFSFCSFLAFLYRVLRHHLFQAKLITILAVVVVRVSMLKLHWASVFNDIPSFQATLYGTNEWLPNFFDYLLSIVLLYFLVLLLCDLIFKHPTFFSRLLLKFSLVILLFGAWFFILYLNKGLIENSSIPLAIDRLFTLNLYSIFAIASIALLYYTFFLFLIEVIQLFQWNGTTQKRLFAYTLIGCGLYTIIDYYIGFQLLVASACLTILMVGGVSYCFKKRRVIQVGFILIFLFLFSLVSAITFSTFISKKEVIEREVVANKLASEQDIVAELEYLKVKVKLQQEPLLLKAINAPQTVEFSTIEKQLEDNIFTQFWERYELSFNLVDTSGFALVNMSAWQQNLANEWNSIRKQHGQLSEIDSTLYFIKDYTQQISYIIRLPILTSSGKQGLFFAVLKSKKIPEEIGFPRLLLSANANVFESVENYSIAKYHNNRLVTKYGRFNYPTTFLALKSWQKNSAHSYSFDQYAHFVLKKSKSDQLILSSKDISWVTIGSWVSYFFAFYGLFLTPFLFRFRASKSWRRTLTLAVKIQLVLVGLVALTLLIFGWGSGLFMRDQYLDFTKLMMRQKMNSVELEMRSKWANKNQFHKTTDGNQLNYYLQNVAKVFATDINFYDTKGFLLASSRPKVFHAGLLSEQINPMAKQALFNQAKSEFMHNEQIGNLDFASNYLPFYANNGKLLGVLNLQHFGQQIDLQHQIQQFLVAIINVFMLLLAVSVVLAISLSSWLTAPLRLLQDSFSKLRFDKTNQQLTYAKDDEIGDLVKEYNGKLLELEKTADQLAKSERESAWREMAKQVAHEIKNPLTPMKLSAQQLMRTFEADDPNAKAKITKVAQSMIEQIDALTTIANEFAHFAKMPAPKMETIDLIPILENVVEVNRIETCDFEIELSLTSALILGDKDQMLRTFNNLIKNAIQAIPADKQGCINIRVTNEASSLHVEMEDNGIGILPDEQSKLFVPYFTTKSSGTGLGLAMVKQIIENHTGTISFQSTPKSGTIFTIVLPMLRKV